MGQPDDNDGADDSEAEDRRANDKDDEVPVNDGPTCNEAGDGEHGDNK